MDGRDLPFRTFGGFTFRYVKDYQFLSGVHNGRIPGLLAFDINAGRQLRPGLALNVSVQNLFACTSGTTTPPAFLNAALPATYRRGWGCGLGREHIELLNMPAIGAMTFIGLRFDR
jgi:outer membrane receptor for ferrienterochelin and colicins